MNTLNRKLIAVAAGLALSTTSALASHIPAFAFLGQDFIVNPLAIGENFAPFVATSATFSYTSEIDQYGGVPGGTTANFDQTGFASFSSFNNRSPSGLATGGTAIGAGTTGLNLGPGTLGYGLYAIFTGIGSVTTAGAPPGGANGTYTSFNVSLFADPNNDTTFAFTTPDFLNSGGNSYYAVPNTADLLVLSGTLVPGAGGFHLSSGLANGDFDTIFTITSFGATNFFSTNTSGQKLTTGDFNGVISTFSGVALPPTNFVDGIVTGSGNVTLSAVTKIPEPGSLALVGLALAGLGFARRKTTAAQQAA